MLTGYPAAVLKLLGDLDSGVIPPEPLADCAHCPMTAESGRTPPPNRRFTTVRCCTYHPSLPNFLVGLVLERGGDGETAMRERLRNPDGVYHLGLTGPLALRELYEREGDERFGRDPSMACPFWVEGATSCGIHPSRGAICRTWHCRHEAGVHGWMVWMELGELLTAIELRLAEHCARTVRRPWPWSRPAVWEAYFRECARVVEGLDDAVVDGLRPGLVGAQVSLRTAIARRDAAMPEHLRIATHFVEPSMDGRWRVAGYSAWDPVEAPPEVVELLRQLGTGGSWREACERAAGATGGTVGEELVHALWLAGVLVRPEGAETG